eukprot:COSAG03_NODE_2255_length_2953_cov_5.919411_4_plen_53_part_00
MISDGSYLWRINIYICIYVAHIHIYRDGTYTVRRKYGHVVVEFASVAVKERC